MSFDDFNKDQAKKSEFPPRIGQIQLDVFKATWQDQPNGKAKLMPFNQLQDNPDDALWSIKIGMIPVDNGKIPFDQNMTDKSPAWWKFTEPTIRKLGLQPGDIHNQFFKVNYKKTEDEYNGVTKTVYWVEFLEMYKSQDEALAAVNGPTPKSNQDVYQVDKSSLLPMIPFVVSQCDGDRDKLIAALAAPPFNGVLSINDPEVQAEFNNQYMSDEMAF